MLKRKIQEQNQEMRVQTIYTVRKINNKSP